MELATEALVHELQRAGIRYARVDTADASDELDNRGRWTFHNTALAVVHLADAARRILRRNVTAVYLPIAQEFPALFRDMAFIAVALIARKPVVVHLHGGKFSDFYGAQRPSIRWMLNQTIGRATLGIVLTERLRPALECLLPPERVVRVENGIDLEETPEMPRRNSDIHVLFLSSLFPWKGTNLFVQAFAAAAGIRPGLRATVAGSWPSDSVRRETVGLAENLGIADRLTFPGSVEGREKTALLQSADIFCFTSLVPEGQPLVILEAMAVGLPVLATNWPGISDTVIDGETGVLIDDPSPASVARALVELIDDPTKCERLGALGRARYERLYTRRAFGERMIDALGPVLDGAVPSPRAALTSEVSE
jgi:glycosyltransferase involved in cell wall biosynthesis